MIIKGKVVSGFGVGRKFLSKPLYKQLFERLLSREPFPGTLNVELMNGLDVNKVIMKCKPSVIQDIKFEDKIYGGFYYWYGEIKHNDNTINVLVIRPFRSKHKDTVIEIISNIELRKKFTLKNGDVIMIQLKCRGERE